MELDSSAPGRPLHGVVRRLAHSGFPEELLDYSGIVSFAKNNGFLIAELVSAILPTDEEAKVSFGSNMKTPFGESMVWLQWLMLEGDPDQVLKLLANRVQRCVCGAVWGSDDIAYQCRTCGYDPTCAVCVPCFRNGNHKDHDYSIIYTTGGCCDCGDVTAWKREGFCENHRGVEQIQPLPDEFVKSVGPVLDALFICWQKKLASADVDIANELTIAVVVMLLEFCDNSDSLLSFSSKRVISLVGLLETLVRAERFLNDVVVGKLQELLLKLLGEPVFKYEFAKVFVSYYQELVNEAIRECSDNAINKYPLLSMFSVQIFTVPTLTTYLVKEMNLLVMLFGCLGDIFLSCVGEDGCLLVTKWANLYETTQCVIVAIQLVLSHVVVSKYAIHDQPDISRTWMGLLAFIQGMNPLKRKTGIHIEEDNECIDLPLILDHWIAKIQPLLVDGAFACADSEEPINSFNIYKQENVDGDNLRHAKVGRLSHESSVCGTMGRSCSSSCALMSDDASHLLVPPCVTWLIHECLRAMESWLGVDDSKSASFHDLLSPDNSNSSVSNFQTLKRTLSKIAKGNDIFSRVTGSNEGAVSCDPDNDTSSGKNCRTTGDSNIVHCKSAGSEHSGVEGNCTAELNALHVLSLPDWLDLNYDVSSRDVSVHIPLHRLLSLILQKALRQCYGESAISTTTSASSENPLSEVYMDFFGHIFGEFHPYGFSAFVMEHPLQIKVFSAQVHAGMWWRNEDAALLSYRSVGWSEQGLELDLFLLQCCAALAPADRYVNRILERFGLSSYLSLNLERSSEYEPVLVQEMLTLIIQILQERQFCGLTTAENLKRELIHKLSIGNATHSQLLKSLPSDLSKFEQLQKILDGVAMYSNPSGLNQGMYSLLRTYWKELDLYHPRWNSRDLQVAEERYLRFCSESALITQLPRWTKIYQPLEAVANIATCKVMLHIIRAVLFYAVFTDKSTESRAPYGVLLTALHLLALALDICFQKRKSGDESCDLGDLIPIFAFASEEISEGLRYGAGKQSLLSLLVALMGMDKKENVDNFLEAGNCNLSSLIECLLKKFAELDSKCMTILQQLAPEVVSRLSQSLPSSDSGALPLTSDSEKHKAKARERQAAILEKMKAEQSKFLSSISSTEDDGLTSSLDASNSDDKHDIDESVPVQDVCSLCHDPNSRTPVSFLILIQKSRLLSFVDRVPPSWEQTQRLGKEQLSNSSDMGTKQSGTNASSSGSGVISSSQMAKLIENAVNQFAYNGTPGEVNAVLDFVKARFPSLRNFQVPCAASNGRESTVSTLEMFEQAMYSSICKEMHVNMHCSNFMEEDEGQSAAKGGLESIRDAESILLGKYIAALSREMKENSSASEISHDDKSVTESTLRPLVYDGFGSVDCDGIHVSSCGHTVHQGCLDRYLSSLNKRDNRRATLDPDQGQFLCPVCRQLANSVLPAFPGEFRNVCKQSMISAFGTSLVPESKLTSGVENNFLWLQQALSLMQSAANFVGKGGAEGLPLQSNERMPTNLETVSCVIYKMHSKSKQDKLSGSTRVSPSLIMWDILKYSIMSMEITARCEKTSMTPIFDVNALYKELKSSNGFVLSLLLKIVQSMRSKNSVHVLLRLRGIQLFAQSICSGVSIGYPGNTSPQGGSLLTILKHADMEMSYPDIQFWNRASDPVLARDPFSSLMWVLYSLPCPFMSCEESILSLVHTFYVVVLAQAIIAYCMRHQAKVNELAFSDCLITDISKLLEEFGCAQEFFVSNYIDPLCNIKDMIRRLSFPYLRRCALLWKLLGSTVSAPFSDRHHELDQSSHDIDDMTDICDCSLADLSDIQELERTFKIPPLDVVLKDGLLRSMVSKWFHHFCKEFEVGRFQCVLHCTPAFPFKLMQLPHLYQDLLQSYIKQCCPDCNSVKDESALCLLCGTLCSPNWKSCCRASECRTHAMTCGAGTGVFLLIRGTTILLQKGASQAHWPSPYLDAFGGEDIELNGRKPLYLNEERYAALAYMVASHSLYRSCSFLSQTAIGGLDLI